ASSTASRRPRWSSTARCSPTSPSPTRRLLPRSPSAPRRRPSRSFRRGRAGLSEARGGLRIFEGPDTMIDELKSLLGEAKAELESASDDAQVEAARIKYLGKKGSLSAVLRGMGKLSAEERPKVG